MVVVSRFEFVLCHTNVGPCVTRGCCDSCFVDNVLCKTRTVKRAKVFACTVAFLFVGGLVVFIKYFLIVAFDYIRHVCSAAVADLQVVSIKYFVEFNYDFGKCLSLRQRNDLAMFVRTF